MLKINKVLGKATAFILALMMIFTYFQPCFDVSAESIKDSSNLLAAVKDSTSQTMNTLADENLANGIYYTEEDITNYRNEVGHRVRFNHLVIDPSAENIKIISAKAQDTVNAMETIGDQAQREVLKGNNVVAGINADSYDMDYGINRGILIKDGCIISSQPNYSYTAEIQDFFVDKNGKAYIDPLRVVGDISAGASYTAETGLVNRNNFGGPAGWAASESTRIYTSRITKNHKMAHGAGTLPDQQAYALIKLDHYDGDLHVAAKYTGKIVKVYSSDGFGIPDDCIVYAGYGAKAAEVAALTVDMPVTYTCHLYTGDYSGSSYGPLADRGTLKDDVVTAVNSFHLLAKNGVVNSSVVDNEGTDNNARTVIGLTKEGKMHVIAAAKPSTYFSDSIGTNFKDITDYMMKELNCVDILNMDGGGSTEMIARRAGGSTLKTVSYPSDGNSRVVGNSLLFVSTASKGTQIGQVVVDGNINIYKGSHYTFSYRLTDTNGNSISTEGHTVIWKSNTGTIDQQGNYTAPNTAGEDVVTATVDGTSGTASVETVDSFATIGLNATGTVPLQKGDKKQFEFTACDISKKLITVDPSTAKWTLSGAGIGTLKDGLLTVTADSGEADISAELLGKTYTAHIIVGLKEQMIDDFESSPAEGYYVGGPMYKVKGTQHGGVSDMLGMETRDMANSRVKNGKYSFRMTYDTSLWKWDDVNKKRTSNGTMNMIPLWDDASDYAKNGNWNEPLRASLEKSYTAKAMPRKFGMWVYSGDENNDGISDNKNCMLTAVFCTKCGGPSDYGVSKSLNMTGSMDWIGWKYLEADIPQDWAMPIVFNYFWMSNTNCSLTLAQNYKTSVLVDDLKYIYSDEKQDLSGPVFSATTPKAGGFYKSKLDFSTVITDEMSGVNASTISVKVNDKPVTDFSFNSESGKLSFSVDALQSGSKYRVIIRVSDNKGNEAVPYIDNTYAVDLTPDTEGPVISEVTPTQNVTVQIPRPRITFKLKDEKSEVDAGSISVQLGDKILPEYYDKETGWGYAEPTEDFSNGTYTLTLNAKDTNGNAMKSYTDTLRIAPISQPSDPNNYKITVIPDTQGNTYSDRIFSRAANDSSSLIVHLGDITDGATQQEYDDAKKYVDTLNKPCFVLEGNHEAFNGNLDLYYKTFGSPTYHFQYGNSLIVVLNSAYGQSVSSSDSTQYHYLQEILKENKLPNVYVFNHVVTRDAFSTEHNMSASEAQQFEGILSSYKKKNPSSNVNVIFGHLHTLYNWKVDGVNYIIGGNAAGKGYVTAEEGNMLGTGMITVSDGTAQYGFDPLLTKIYIKNDALIGNTLKTFEGAKVQLNLYGDFREYPSNYLTQLNSHELVNITWTSSDPQIATVDKNGVITANGIGQTEVTAVSGGKTSKIILETLDPSKVDAAKIELSLLAKINVGKTILPTVKATDPYGTVFALNNKDVQFTFKNNLMSKQKDSTLLAIKAGMESVTAEFKGKRAAASVQIGELNPSEADVASIQLKLPEKVDVGKTVVPVVKATDPYGNIFELDNRNVQFLFQNGLMNTPKDGTLVASRAGKETVTAAFKGKKSVAQIEILSVSDDSGSSKHSNESRGASKTTESTTPSTVVTSTNQMGGTVATVSTQPDSTPVLTGNKSNVSVTVPTEVATIVSAATKEKPAEVKVSAPTASLVEQLKNDTVKTVDLTISVPPVVASNTNANAKVSINVEPAVLQAAKDAKKDITVEVVNSATGNMAYSWTFTGANLTNSAASLTSVNLAITVEPAKNDTAAAAVTAANTSDRKPAGVVLNFAHSGLLPATAYVRVYVGNQPGVTPFSKMFLYYFNKVTNILEQLPQCEFTVDAQGYVTVSVAHCSEYVLLQKPATNAYAIKSDTWTTVGVKSGKTYTYAMMVSGNTAPSFTVGNGKTFALTVKRFGSKYYVTIRATGAAGTVTAVYSTLPKQKPVIMGYAVVAK